jgi:hypothetical protein
MSTEISNEFQPARRRWPWALLMVVVLLVGADQAYRMFVRFRVQAEMTALRKDGYPVGLLELQKSYPPVADQDNAAVRIMEAADFLALGPDAFGRNLWPARGEEFGPEERDNIKDLLTNNAPALEAVHLAAKLKQSRFPLDYTKGPAMLLPHLAKMKSLTLLLRVEAAVYSEEGRPDLAVKSVLDSVALARALDTEPLLISQLVRIACLAIDCSSLEWVLTQHALSEAQLGALSESFHGAREASQTAFPGGYLGEVGLGVYCFTTPPAQFQDMMNQDTTASQFVQVLYPLYSWTGLRDRDFAFYLRMMHRMLDTTKVPFPERIAKSRQSGERTNHELEGHKLLIFSRMLLPALQRTSEKAADLEARLRCAEAALAVESQRVKNHRPIPEALAQVTQAGAGAGGLTDPIDGAPLRSRTLEPGYVIYSVGLDGVDNGGLEREPSGNSGIRKLPLSTDSEANSPKGKRRQQTNAAKGYDITFTVER